MTIDVVKIAQVLSAQTGIGFEEGKPLTRRSVRSEEEKTQAIVVPHGHAQSQSFSISGVVGWRHVEVTFSPGVFAGGLVKEMGETKVSRRQVFVSVLRQCFDLGATIKLSLNGKSRSFADTTLWDLEWKNVEISMRKGQLDPRLLESEGANEVLSFWMSQLASSIVSLLPVEEIEQGNSTQDLEGFPEGALTKVSVNRYERDPRNRAAALAIHGSVCLVCNRNLADYYGEVATGAIEVHHITPVSDLNEGYEFDPSKDLVPLCPNCHCIAHKRNPPYSVKELKKMWRSSYLARSQGNSL